MLTLQNAEGRARQAERTVCAEIVTGKGILVDVFYILKKENQGRLAGSVRRADASRSRARESESTLDADMPFQKTSIFSYEQCQVDFFIQQTSPYWVASPVLGPRDKQSCRKATFLSHTSWTWHPMEMSWSAVCEGLPAWILGESK